MSLTRARYARTVGEKYAQTPLCGVEKDPKGYALTDQLKLIGSPNNQGKQLRLVAPAVDKPPVHRTEPVDGPYGVRDMTTAPRPSPPA